MQASEATNSLLVVSFYIGMNMRLIELFEAKTDKKVVSSTTPRNFVAKNAKMGGAGKHKDKKRDAKQGVSKHKNSQIDEQTV